MKFFLKTAVFVLFFLCFSFKAEAQSRFGESWYRGGFYDPVSSAISPKGDIITLIRYRSAFYDSTSIDFHDAMSGTLLKKIPIRNSLYGYMLWSQDGRSIIISSEYEQVSFIDTATGKSIKSLEANNGELAYSPSGKYLFVGETIFETSNWKKVSTPITIGGFNQTEKFVMLPGDSTGLRVTHYTADTMKLLRFPSGEIIRTISIANQSKSNIHIAVNSNGTVVAVNSAYPDSVILVQIGDGKIISTIGHENLYSWHLTFSNNDSMLLAGRSLIEISSKKHLGMLPILAKHVSSDFSNFYGQWSNFLQYNCSSDDMPTQKTAFLAVRRNGSVMWRLPNGHGNKVRSIRVDKDNTLITTDADNEEISWNYKGEIFNRKKLVTPPPIDSSEEFSYTERYSFKMGILRDNFTDSTIGIFYSKIPYPAPDRYNIFAWAWSPNERYFLISVKPQYKFSMDSYFKLVELPSGRVVDSAMMPCHATIMRISPNGSSYAAATEEYGIMWGKLNTTISSIEDNILKDFSLNFYPNPLQESSTISCSLPTDSVVKITLHDMLGREVAILHDDFKSAGNYTFPFKAENLPNGFYFLKMSVGGRSLTKSVSIVR